MIETLSANEVEKGSKTLIMECIHAQQHTLQCYMHFEIQMFEQATQKLEITDKLKLMRRNDLTLRVSL